MKFIHMSDIHLGMTPDPTSFWSEERANDIRKSFANVIEKCKNEDIDLLLISGDLFNHQPLSDDLLYVNNLFKSIMDTRIVIIAGSSDHIKTSSPILNFKFSENVYYFFDKTEIALNIDNKTIIIHGFSYFSFEDSTPIINSITPEDDNNIHILLAYAGDMNHSPFDINKLKSKNFSYIALGSDHNYKELIPDRAYYAGSLEPLNQSDIGEHGVIVGDIDLSTRQVVNLKFEKIANVSYVPITIKINGSNNEDDIVEIVIREVLKLGAQNIYKIKITGYRNPDLEITRDIFSKKIRISEIIDNSIPKYDFIKLSSEHPQDMIGAYIRRMYNNHKDQENLSDVEKRALYLGTHALIKTSENKNI